MAWRDGQTRRVARHSLPSCALSVFSQVWFHTIKHNDYRARPLTRLISSAHCGNRLHLFHATAVRKKGARRRGWGRANGGCNLATSICESGWLTMSRRSCARLPTAIPVHFFFSSGYIDLLPTHCTDARCLYVRWWRRTSHAETNNEYQILSKSRHFSDNKKTPRKKKKKVVF